MSRAKLGPNQFERLSEYSLLLIDHKGRVVAVQLDHDDVPKARQHRWSVGMTSSGYPFVQTSAWIPGVGQRTIRLARFLLDAPLGAWVDHVNRDPLDMRRANLRLVSPSGNAQNRGASRLNAVGVRGVTLYGNRFRARVQVDGRLVNLGRFESLRAAQSAVVAYRRKNMPFSTEDCPAAGQFKRS